MTFRERVRQRAREIEDKPLCLRDWIVLLFIALRRTDQIDWSWWWVLAPLWGGILIGALFTKET